MIHLCLGPLANATNAHMSNLFNNSSSSSSTVCDDDNENNNNNGNNSDKNSENEAQSFLLVDFQSNIASHETNHFALEQQQQQQQQQLQYQGQYGMEVHRQMSVVEPYDSRWGYWRQQKLSTKSLCSLPNWTDENTAVSSFDTYLSGTRSEHVSELFRDEFSDKLRLLLESHDHVRSVVVTSEINNGFGGVACQLLQEMREHHLPHTLMPLFALDNTPRRTPLHNNNNNNNNNNSDAGKRGLLQQLSVPLAYAQLSEHVNAFIPIYVPSVRQQFSFKPPSTTTTTTTTRMSSSELYNVSAVLGATLMTLLSPVVVGFTPDFAAQDSSSDWREDPALKKQQQQQQQQQQQGKRDELNSTAVSRVGVHDWWSSVSNNNRFPFLRIEATAPCDLGYDNNDYRNYFEPYFSSSTTTTTTTTRLNPFLHSLSSADYSLTSTTLAATRTESSGNNNNNNNNNNREDSGGSAGGRALSNVVVFRGANFSSGLTDFLFKQCLRSNNSSFALTSAFQCPFAVNNISSNNNNNDNAAFPYFRARNEVKVFDSIQQQQQQQQQQHLSFGAALGANESVGFHLEQAANIINNNSFAQTLRTGGSSVYDDEMYNDNNDDDNNNNDNHHNGSNHSNSNNRRRAQVGVEKRRGGASNISSQLEQLGLDKDDCRHLVELLLSIAKKYY